MQTHTRETPTAPDCRRWLPSDSSQCVLTGSNLVMGFENDRGDVSRNGDKLAALYFNSSTQGAK